MQAIIFKPQSDASLTIRHIEVKSLHHGSMVILPYTRFKVAIRPPTHVLPPMLSDPCLILEIRTIVQPDIQVPEPYPQVMGMLRILSLEWIHGFSFLC